MSIRGSEDPPVLSRTKEEHVPGLLTGHVPGLSPKGKKQKTKKKEEAMRSTHVGQEVKCKYIQKYRESHIQGDIQRNIYSHKQTNPLTPIQKRSKGSKREKNPTYTKQPDSETLKE